MKEYISREAATRSLYDYLAWHRACGVQDEQFQEAIKCCAERILNDTVTIKTADVAPVVHATWIFEDEDDYRPRCAKCDHIASGDSENYFLSNYCPKIGRAHV